MGARGSADPVVALASPREPWGERVDSVEALAVLSNMRAHSGLDVDARLSGGPLSVENPSNVSFSGGARPRITFSVFGCTL